MTLDIGPSFEFARIEDHAMHAPGDADWFQESAFFNFCDPAAGVFSYNRIGVHPNLGVANAYSFTTAEPLDLASRIFDHAQPLPAGPVTDCRVGHVAFTTVEPMREYRIRVERDDVSIDVTWRPFFWPISAHSAVGGASFASGHYNAIGRAVGTIASSAGSVAIDAFGYTDHSWGERKNHFPASKWLLAVFDEGHFVQAFPVLGVDGASRFLIGYAARDGRLRKLTNDFATGFAIREDWLTPASCDATLTDEDGRTFRLAGETFGPEGIYPFLHGKFCVHAGSRFTMDGRVGKGLLENSPPRAILGGYVERYGLDTGGMWLRPPGEIRSGPGAG
jgi:hypothetical protein